MKNRFEKLFNYDVEKISRDNLFGGLCKDLNVMLNAIDALQIAVTALEHSQSKVLWELKEINKREKQTHEESK